MPRFSAAMASLMMGLIWLRRKMMATAISTAEVPTIHRMKMCEFDA